MAEKVFQVIVQTLRSIKIVQKTLTEQIEEFLLVLFRSSPVHFLNIILCMQFMTLFAQKRNRNRRRRTAFCPKFRISSLNEFLL